MTGKAQELHNWKKVLPSQTYCYGKNVPLFVAIIESVQVFELVTNMGSCLVCVPMYAVARFFALL